jgi:hypothetical protein
MDIAVQIASIAAFALLASILVILILLLQIRQREHNELIQEIKNSIVKSQEIADSVSNQLKTMQTILQDSICQTGAGTVEAIRSEAKSLTTAVDQLRISLEESVKF